MVRLLDPYQWFIYKGYHSNPSKKKKWFFSDVRCYATSWGGVIRVITRLAAKIGIKSVKNLKTSEKRTTFKSWVYSVTVLRALFLTILSTVISRYVMSSCQISFKDGLLHHFFCSGRLLLVIINSIIGYTICLKRHTSTSAWTDRFVFFFRTKITFKGPNDRFS